MMPASGQTSLPLALATALFILQNLQLMDTYQALWMLMGEHETGHHIFIAQLLVSTVASPW